MLAAVVAARAALASAVTGLAEIAVLVLVAGTVYLLVLALTGRQLVRMVLSTGRRLLAAG
jgi:hypothetical protein